MKIALAHPRWVLLLLLVLAAVGLSACASTESDNASVRPWNSPYGWENGLPSSMNQGH